MKVLIEHDAIGRIVSITQMMPGSAHEVGFLPDAGNSVLELDLSPEFEQKPLIDVHNQCRIDLKTRKLVTR